MEYLFQTPVTGRYLLQRPSDSGPAPLLVGFHGYGQTAEDELALLCSIPGSGAWLSCSIEALHAIYTPKGTPGASWMTSRFRERRIEENVCYVDALISRVMREHALTGQLVYHGFSQGALMACRAAMLGANSPGSLMLLGGDIPLELPVGSLMGSVHIARGSRDRLYSQSRFERDCATLQSAGVPFHATTFTGGHGPNKEYFAAAGAFLAQAARNTA
ncbi:MAG: phospholipase [Chlorobiaceae bacterium]